MKKLFSIVIAAAIAMTLTACNSSPTDEVQKPADILVNEAVEENKQEEQQGEVKEDVQNVPEKTGSVTIEETVLVDEAGVKITANSLDTKGSFGPELKLLIENNSGKDLVFQCRNASVNGYMIETIMSVDVANGKKANDELTFMSSDLELCGIETIANLEVSFHIYDTGDWKTYLDTSMIQLSTSAADTYVQTYDDSGDEVYNANGIRIVVKGLSENSSVFGPSLIVYMENNRDDGIAVQTRDESINGFMVDGILSSDVAAGKRAMETITFSSTDIQDNGITDIETIELYFHIFKSDNWDTIEDTDIIKLSF